MTENNAVETLTEKLIALKNLYLSRIKELDDIDSVDSDWEAGCLDGQTAVYEYVAEAVDELLEVINDRSKT